MKQLFTLFVIALLGATMSAEAQEGPTYWSDSGYYDTNWYVGHEDETSYTLSDAADLAGLAYLVNKTPSVTFEDKTITLGIDIDLSDHEWVSIGNAYEKPFKGSFDGHNKEITGLTIKGGNAYSGLFGCIIAGNGKTVTIQNVTVSGEITGGVKGSDYTSCTGGILGLGSGTISFTNCTNNANVTGGNHNSSYTGGILGSGNGTITFTGCANSGTITGKGTNTSSTGGILGNGAGAGTLTLTGCANGGTITEEAAIEARTYIGGIIGSASSYGTSTLRNCYSNATITAAKGYAGGIAGLFYTSGEGGTFTLSDSYAAGTIDGGDNGITGGIAGGLGIYDNGAIPTLKNCLAVMTSLSGKPTHRIAGVTGTINDFGGITADPTSATLTNNYAYVEDESEGWTDDAAGLDGGHWTGMMQQAPVSGWNTPDVAWVIDVTSQYLPRLVGETKFILPNPLAPAFVLFPSPTYYPITLEVAPGIDLHGLTAGTHTLEEGGHLHLQFLPEDRTLGANDILLLIDGVETPFKDFGAGNYFSYILSPVNGDHTILLALKEYTVTLPEGFYQLPGDYNVAYGEPFLFHTWGTNQGTLKVYANGEQLDCYEDQNPLLRQDQGPEVDPVRLFYLVEKVIGPVVITAEGSPGSLTGNGNIAPGDIQLRMTNYELQIENTTGQAVDVNVYTVQGKNIVQLRGLRGSKSITLPPGIYFVKAAGTVYKITIN